MLRIVTDSGADISFSEAAKRDIDIVSLKVVFEGKTYAQAEDENFSVFYDLLKNAKKLPKTSQPSPEAYAKVYQDAKDKGDSVLVICLSGGLSGTYQSALLAKEMVQGISIHVIDSKSAIMGQRLLVEKALEMRAAGASLQDIVQALTLLKDRVEVVGVVDTLTYLYKGGRLPRTASIVGNLLHIKPVVALEHNIGSIILASKGRGYQAIINHFFNGPKWDPAYPIYFGYADVDDICQKVVEQIKERVTLQKTSVFPIGSIIGAHLGPRCVAMAYVRAE